MMSSSPVASPTGVPARAAGQTSGAAHAPGQQDLREPARAERTFEGVAMRIAVVGAGGVGGWLAARLAAAGRDVHLVARGTHLTAVREHGLTLRSPAGDVTVAVPATDDAARIGPCDAVLFTVKSYDVPTAAAHLPPLVGPRTTIAPLQNGVDAAERVAEVVGPERVVGGLALISSGIAGPGVVEHAGGPARIVLGDLPGGPAGRAEALVRACAVPGVDAQHDTAIRPALWDKFAFLCALAGTTATTRLPLGSVRSCPASWAMFRDLVAEVYAVARAEGIDPGADAVERTLAFVEGLEPHILASLYHDLVGGRRLELDALHGTVVRLGRRHGVPTPMSQAVEAILRPHAERASAPKASSASSGPR
jgi:2-dehydropantoate 2-reductase